MRLNQGVRVSPKIRTERVICIESLVITGPIFLRIIYISYILLWGCRRERGEGFRVQGLGFRVYA